MPLVGFGRLWSPSYILAPSEVKPPARLGREAGLDQILNIFLRAVGIGGGGGFQWVLEGPQENFSA